MSADDAVPRRPRRPNKRGPVMPADGAHVLVLKPHERRMLKHYDPPASGSALGGAQKFVNLLLDRTYPDSGICTINDAEFGRLVRYCRSDAKGGPNAVIRAVFIPALRRAKIDVRADWSAPMSEEQIDGPTA